MEWIGNYLKKQQEAAPLAVFRIFFGVMMLWSLIRFWAKGWIERVYLEPKFHFTYYGFEWVKPLGNWTYLLFVLCILASICILFGYKYRLAIIVFFLSFTYVELMEKSTYLNHYYFVSVLSFLLMFLPANAYYSIDAYINPKRAFQKVPRWTIDSIKLLLGVVYVYAGLAKLNSDWLVRAMPLKIWLPPKYDIPFIGGLMGENWAHYAFSWSGAFYDLTIPFFLLYKRTRPFAFAAVVVFHILTRVLFNIGMFPYIMIMATLIFFDAGFHHEVLAWISKLFNIAKSRFDNGLSLTGNYTRLNAIQLVLVLFFVVQLLFPWRYTLYPGELFWTEEGYRFSWRVMLIEKAGYAQFRIVNGKTGKQFYVENSDFLTPLQEKQMSFQPDFILEYAHFLQDHFAGQGHKNIEVYVDCGVTLNGRRSAQFIDPTIDLTKIKESFKHKTWVTPLKDEIKGI
ncbi:MAG: HTTM domain-containing protein [Bacteroidota bacterium]